MYEVYNFGGKSPIAQKGIAGPILYVMLSSHEYVSTTNPAVLLIDCIPVSLC